METEGDRYRERELLVWHQVWRPGFWPGNLSKLMDLGVRAFIIEGYHSGTAHACGEEDGHASPCPYSIVPFLEEARERQIPVFILFGWMVKDIDNHHGYKPFEGKADHYVTTNRMLKAGMVPLRANWVQTLEVWRRLDEIVDTTQDYQRIIEQMQSAYPFETNRNP